MGVSHAKCRHFWQTANAFFMWHLQKSKTNFHPSVGLSAACLISSHCIAFWSFFTFLIFFLAIPHLLPSWEILASICPKNSLDIFSRFECFINKSSLFSLCLCRVEGRKKFLCVYFENCCDSGQFVCIPCEQDKKDEKERSSSGVS